MGIAPHFAPKIGPLMGMTPHKPPLFAPRAPPRHESIENNIAGRAVRSTRVTDPLRAAVCEGRAGVYHQGSGPVGLEIAEGITHLISWNALKEPFNALKQLTHGDLV